MKPTPSASEMRDAINALRKFIARAAVYSFFTNMLVLAPTLYMLEVYGRVVYSRNTDTLIMLMLLVIGLFVVMEILDWVRNRLMDAASVHLDRELADRVFNATFEARLRNIPIGIMPLNDLRTVRGFLASPAFIAMMDAPFAMLFIVIIFLMSPVLGSLVLGAAVAMLIVAYATERRTKPPLIEAQKLSAEAQRYASTTLKNAQVIQAMGMMESIRDRWLTRQRKFLVRQAEASDHAGGAAALSKFIQIAQGSMVLGLACYLTLVGELQAGGGAMIVAWTLSSRALGPLQQLISQWKTVVGVRTSYARLNTFLGGMPVRAAGMELPPPNGALAVESVIAAAPGTQTSILRGVTFALAPGQVLAVVGPTASGKSTLARLLMGLWPALSGKVRLDGVDVFTWNKEELGPHVGYLPQDNELFDGTLAENIARFGDIDRAKVEAAASAVGLHEAIVALPDGYDTPIGSGGAVLSGGQRQRVALARAIYGEPSFIVLDEPNSSLDEPGDRALLHTLTLQKARGATLVIITHRTNVLAVADRMLLLRDGAMEMFGPRDEVLAALREKAKQPAAAAVPMLAAT
jgi:ATP-binding cassette, subfamily C, bacterial exporter for protease/lipase